MNPPQVFTILVICALIGVPLGRWKNAWWRGFLAGLLLGPLGLLIMLLIPVSEETQVQREQQRMKIQQEAAARMESDRR